MKYTQYTLDGGEVEVETKPRPVPVRHGGPAVKPPPRLTEIRLACGHDQIRPGTLAAWEHRFQRAGRQTEDGTFVAYCPICSDHNVEVTGLRELAANEQT